MINTARPDTVLVLAEFIRTEISAIQDVWTARIERLPPSDAPSLATHGREVLAWVASSLEEQSRDEDPSNDLPGGESFSAARAIAELALLTETIGNMQPPSLDDVARDSLHCVIDAAIAHSLARDTHESDRLRKRLRLATDVTLVGSWELDPRNDALAADERSCELFGVVDGDPITVDELTFNVHPDDRQRVREGIELTVETGRPYMAECRTLRRDNGMYRWIAIAADTLGGNSPSLRLLGIVHDITDQRRAEEEHARVIDELSRAVHISEMFVGILSHDLRNPLSAILGGANLLTHERPDEKSARILARVVSSGERMGRMIDQLLDFTRARLGEGIPLQREPMDLSALAQEVVDDAKVASPGFVLKITSRGDTVGAWDKDRLSQIVSNLIGNALQHGQASGVVDVVIDGTDGDCVDLTIENSGTIPPALLPVIFNPFRGTLQKLGKSRGLGLGLYVARQIALAHGGELKVESTSAGTVVFTLRLQRSVHPVTLSKQERVREEEMAAFERMAAPLSTTAITARLFGATPLHERVPADHADIAERYAALLDMALHRTVYRGQGEGLAQDLRALADRLGDLGAGPREVTELHARALRQAVRGVTAAKTQALLSEGRLLALELMGNLASYYRRRASGQRTMASSKRTEA
jgi:PAS domain S-box-containing protein